MNTDWPWMRIQALGYNEPTLTSNQRVKKIRTLLMTQLIMAHLFSSFKHFTCTYIVHTCTYNGTGRGLMLALYSIQFRCVPTFGSCLHSSEALLGDWSVRYLDLGAQGYVYIQ